MPLCEPENPPRGLENPPCEPEEPEWEPENPPCEPPRCAEAGSTDRATTIATAARRFMPPFYACFRVSEPALKRGQVQDQCESELPY